MQVDSSIRDDLPTAFPGTNRSAILPLSRASVEWPWLGLQLRVGREASRLSSTVLALLACADYYHARRPFTSRTAAFPSFLVVIVPWPTKSFASELHLALSRDRIENEAMLLNVHCCTLHLQVKQGQGRNAG